MSMSTHKIGADVTATVGGKQVKGRIVTIDSASGGARIRTKQGKTFAVNLKSETPKKPETDAPKKAETTKS